MLSLEVHLSNRETFLTNNHSTDNKWKVLAQALSGYNNKLKIENESFNPLT